MATYFAIVFGFIGVGYFIAYTKKGKVGSTTIGSRTQELHSPAAPDEVFERIAALGAPYTIDDKDASRGILVVSSPVTFFSWGFLYPVLLRAESTGTRIQIGCTSKFIQMGPVVTNAHGKCVAALRQALSISGARIA